MSKNDSSEKAGTTPSSDNQKTIDQKKRRKLLKTIAAGGAASTLLPQKWSKPVVDSVMLPAHAQMSPGALVACQVTGFLFSGTQPFSSFSSNGISTGSPGTTQTTGVGSGTIQFTFAILSGTVTSIGTFNGTGSYTFTQTQIIGITSGSGYEYTDLFSWVFDSTCFG